jgi:DHA3 family tetracycline resistance protein-like MFS transporter
MAGALPLVMRETGFAPADHADLSGWQAMLRTASQAVALARRRPIVLWLLISGVVVGLYSEGYDRLWMPHLLQNVGLPDAPALPTATWFAGVRMISAMLGIGVVEFTRRRLLTSHDRRLRWVLSGAALGIVAGILVVALAGSFWLAALAVIIIGPLRTATELLRDAWLNRQIDDPTVRATIFSALGQADSVGQVVGGPAIGWLARAVSIPLAMTVSALLLTPVVPIYALTGRKNTEYIASGNSVG